MSVFVGLRIIHGQVDDLPTAVYHDTLMRRKHPLSHDHPATPTRPKQVPKFDNGETWIDHRIKL
jgi:hypothetical protein